LTSSAKVLAEKPARLMPWGNRAAQFRDLEGTLVLMYTPVTEAAKKRFGDR